MLQESAWVVPPIQHVQQCFLQLFPMEPRTWPWGKQVAALRVQGTLYDASSSYDASRGCNDSPRRHVLVQRTQERVMGRAHAMVPVSS